MDSDRNTTNTDGERGDREQQDPAPADGPASPTAPTGRTFMGYRSGIFNCATQFLGGAVTVRRFDPTTP